MLRYIEHYSETTKAQVKRLIEFEKLGDYLLGKYPEAHAIATDKALYDYANELKNTSMRKAPPLTRCFTTDA